jgi:hypothetical protein
MDNKRKIIPRLLISCAECNHIAFVFVAVDIAVITVRQTNFKRSAVALWTEIPGMSSLATCVISIIELSWDLYDFQSVELSNLRVVIIFRS